jgi:putative transposase
MPNYRRVRVPGGRYFFTVVTDPRRPVLTSASTRAALRAAIDAVREAHPFHVDAWVLLPDHLHCIWRLPDGDADFPIRWAKIKRLTRERLGMQPTEKFWQPRYWEHCIRDDDDLARHLDYIHWNPVKHGMVGIASAWPFSTVHRFIASGVYPPDWGTTEDRFANRRWGE